MAETQAQKSKKDLLKERMLQRNPQAQLEDEEAFYGQISDDYDQYDQDLAARDQELTGYREREQKLTDMFTSDPRSARMMLAWRDGEDPAIALIRLYGDDIKEALDDPEKQQAIAEANKEFMEQAAKEKEYEQEHASNLEQSLKNLEQAQAELGLSDEQLDQAMSWVITLAKDAMMGKFTPETIQMAIKAQNYDTDLEQAQAEGEIRGRNAKIKESLRKPTRGDGMAQLDGKNGPGAPRRQLPDLGALENYNDGNMTIFERGGEKRTPVRR